MRTKRSSGDTLPGADACGYVPWLPCVLPWEAEGLSAGSIWKEALRLCSVLPSQFTDSSGTSTVPGVSARYVNVKSIELDVDMRPLIIWVLCIVDMAGPKSRVHPSSCGAEGGLASPSLRRNVSAKLRPCTTFRGGTRENEGCWAEVASVPIIRRRSNIARFILIVRKLELPWAVALAASGLRLLFLDLLSGLVFFILHGLQDLLGRLCHGLLLLLLLFLLF